MRKRFSLAVVGLALVAACSHDVATGRRCKAPCSDDPARDGGTNTGMSTAGSGGIDTSENDLSVHVEDIDAMEIEVITIACAGECADIQAIAHGGHAPYSFVWEDGSTTAARHVCLSESQQLSVTATDTAISSEEFDYDAQSAVAQVSASVLACNDASVPHTPGDFCIENPSLEGVAGVAEITGFMLPGWSMCYLSPNVEPGGGGSSMPASDDSTYLGALDAYQDSLNESAGTSFCEPLTPGHTVSFSVDIAVSASNDGDVKMELWGGSTPCSKDELLWTSPVVTDSETWHTFCGSFSATKAYEYLTTGPVLASADAKASYVNLDNFRPQTHCEQ